MAQASLADKKSRNKRTIEPSPTQARERNPAESKNIVLIESGKKSTGKTLTFKPAEEDEFQISAGISADCSASLKRDLSLRVVNAKESHYESSHSSINDH